MYAYLTTLIIKCEFFEKPFNFECVEKERELRVLAKNKRINEIKWLKEEAEINKDELLDDLSEGKNKISKLLTDFEYKKQCIKWYCSIGNKIRNITWTNWWS